LALAGLRENDAASQSFATVGAQQSDSPCGPCRHIAPTQVGHEFIADGEPNALLYEHIPRKAACSEVLQCSLIAKQAVGVEFDGGGKRADLVGASYRRALRRRPAATNDANRGLTNARIQPMCSVPERELLDLLNERNCVAANLATEAHKPRGASVHDEVWTAAVHVKRTPADECRSGATQLDSVSLDDFGDGMLLTDALGINAFSGRSIDGSHDACG
jgi:hypothetical protein